ncbi:MAG: hypothetical protein J6V08_01970, partial [Candidatus Methanomethylophilaceae archaeon]|nr:hypothetical protein [Candidatus Methanomethylophilaceae archaeon]
MYGDADPAPFSVNIDGTAYPELIAFDVERDAGENVGTYAVTVSGNEYQGNYQVSFVSGTFSITKRALTVTADYKNVVYTNAVPVYTATYNGFANGDDVSDLSGSLVFACGYAPNAAYSATFDIVPSGLTS